MPTERKALCVSIHDVAPATWPACQRLLAAIHEVADIPLTLLVVPCYHGHDRPDPGYDAMLTALLARGHELALHGYRHLDSGPPASGWRKRWLRGVYTRNEGEFSALSAAQSRLLLALGLEWFDRRGWPVDGFVPPAWLLGSGAWLALRDAPFSYTTTWTHFHLLSPRRRIWSPSLVYAARNRSGRQLSPRLAVAQAACMGAAGLVRLGLHPADAAHPALLRHAQHLLGALLESRVPMTKAAFARQSRSL
ncbi:polysaccharide deacetylase family protein [Oxalobacteraceae bacterium OTU3CINTB1]|nr:polysaccharide deacetylase family protein [Oxalobacteraceae bacterium OTU3CINTB1]